MFKKMIATGLMAGLLCSGSAMAWWDDNEDNSQRPGFGDDLDAVGIDNSQVAFTSKDMIVKLKIGNQRNYKRVCDYFASIKSTNGDSTGIEKDYLEKRTVRKNRTYEHNFKFYAGDLANGYKFIKKSMKTKGSCVGMNTGDTSTQVPNPHTLCDPEYETCNQTCPGDAVSNDCFGDW